MIQTGGLVKNSYLMQLLADICGVPIHLPFSSSASVVLGAAMLGAFAAKAKELNGDGSQTQAATATRNWEIMKQMSREGSVVQPQVKSGSREWKLLEAKYKIFRECIVIQKRWREEVNETLK
jgi:ribulose kinase